MITIHGRLTSVNVQIAMWAIGELGLDHNRLDVGGVFGGNDKSDFLAMNPNGLVPVLQDGDVTLFESAAIVRYLGARYGDGNFWPADPADRARLDQWAEWGKSTFYPPMIQAFIQIARTPEAKRDMAAVKAAETSLARLAAIADARIGKGPFLAGDRFSFADILFAHQLYRYMTLPIARSATPALDAYYQRLSERPAYAAYSMVPYDSLMVK